MAGFAHHGAAAVAAEQLVGEEVFNPCPGASGRPAVHLQHLLRFLEGVFVDDGRHAALVADILVFIHAGVFLVLDELAQAVHGERFAANGAHALRVEPFHDFGNRLAVCVAVENLFDIGGGLCIDLVFFGFLVDGVAKGVMSADGLGLFGAFVLAAPHVLGELKGIVFRHAFQHRIQNDALRPFRHFLGHALHTDAVFAAAVTVEGDLLPVAAETVDFPQKDDAELVLGRVGQHLLELLPVVVAAGHGPVGVGVYDGVALAHGVGLRCGNLPLDGLLGLTVGGVAGINDCIGGFHGVSSKK